MKDPCDGCKQKEEDDWGLVCDIACGLAFAYGNYEAGADALLDALIKENLLSIYSVEHTKVEQT